MKNAIYIGIFVVYFLFIIITSLRSSKKVETMSDFTTGGNKMGLLLGVGTSMATWLSVASVMGVPGNIYSRGVCAVFGWVAGWFLATGLMPLVAYKIRRPEVPSRTFPEFMRTRYDPFTEKSPIQIFSAAIELVGYFVFSYIQIQGFGIVFSTLTGIPYPIACLCFMILLIFTCMGGFESVAATDTLNASLILVGVIAAMIAVLTECISYFLSNCFGSTVAPHWVSRFMAPRNAKTAALQMFLVMVILIAVFCPLILIGMGGKMIMPSLPEGITSDYMFPRLIMDHIHPVLGALALTAICAAAVSTANSMLLHCSTSLIYDIKRVLQGGEASEAEDAKTTKQLRITILSLGVIAVICAIGQFSLLADGFTYVYGAFGSMFFASIWLGLYVKRMNNAAAFASMLTGLAAYIYCMVAGAPFGLPAFIVSCGLSLVAAAIGILVGKKPPLEAYESYFSDNVSAKTLEVAHKIRKDVV